MKSLDSWMMLDGGRNSKPLLEGL